MVQYYPFDSSSDLSVCHKPENTYFREVSLCGWPPVYFVWIQALCSCWFSISFTCLVKSKPVKQEVSCTVMLPPPHKPWRVSQRLINIFHSFSLYVLKRSLKITWTFKGHTSEPWYLLGINIAGGVCIMLWAAVCSFIIFYTLNFFCLFRIKPQVEFKGMDVCEHGEAAYPVDAWIEQQYNHNSENERPTIPKNMQGING